MTTFFLHTLFIRSDIFSELREWRQSGTLTLQCDKKLPELNILYFQTLLTHSYNLVRFKVSKFNSFLLKPYLIILGWKKNLDWHFFFFFSKLIRIGLYSPLCSLTETPEKTQMSRGGRCGPNFSDGPLDDHYPHTV